MGTLVHAQADEAHRGTVVAHFIADLLPSRITPAPSLFYVVELERGAWLGGDSCSTGRAWVAHLVVHADNVTTRCHGHELEGGGHRCSELCTNNECCLPRTSSGVIR